MYIWMTVLHFKSLFFICVYNMYAWLLIFIPLCFNASIFSSPEPWAKCEFCDRPMLASVRQQFASKRCLLTCLQTEQTQLRQLLYQGLLCLLM